MASNSLKTNVIKMTYVRTQLYIFHTRKGPAGINFNPSHRFQPDKKKVPWFIYLFFFFFFFFFYINFIQT